MTTISATTGRYLLTSTLLAGLAVASAGCSSPAAARQRWQSRRASLDRIVASVRDREAERAGRLARAAERIRTDVAGDVQALPRDLRRLRDYVERDLRTFQEQQPKRRQQARQLLRGKPETIGRTVVILFL